MNFPSAGETGAVARVDVARQRRQRAVRHTHRNRRHRLERIGHRQQEYVHRLPLQIKLATRRVQIAGISTEPNGPWVTQLMRNATDAEDGFLRGTRMLIHDRDPLYSQAVRDTLTAAGVTPVRLPARSPNLNAFAERFVRTVEESCLERMILIGEGSLRRAIHEFVDHYHHERNHQELSNRLIQPLPTSSQTHGSVQCRQRLGGMLKYYYRPAA